MEISVTNKAEKFAYINLAILLLLSIKAYPRWFMPSGMYQIIFMVTTALSLMILNPVIEKSAFKMRMIVLIILYAIFFYLPFFHEYRPGYFFDCIIFIEISLLPVSVFCNAYGLLRRVFFWICLFAIIIWIIHVLGFDLPSYTLKRTEIGGVVTSKQIYHIYGPVLSIYGGDLIERASGVFAEPGHFGIYIGIIMATNKFRFGTKEDIIMLIAGILTFSTAFYGILGLGLFYKFFLDKNGNNDYRKLIPLFILAIMVLVASDTVKEVAIGRVVKGRNVSSVYDLVENRVLQTTKSHYNKLLESDKIWIGEGKTDTDIVQETNWRGGVYRYGILGMMVFIVLLLNVVSIAPLKYQLLLLSIIALIMSHRIYQFFYTGLPYLVYVASLLNSNWSKCELNDLVNTKKI